MAKTSYPAKADLDALLTSAGIALGTLDTQSAVDAGVRAFEQEVGRRLLAAGSDGTAYFDPPVNAERFLWFGQDLAALTSVVYRPQGGTAETLAQNTDFFLEPYNTGAAIDGIARPYLGMRFASGWTAPLRREQRRAIEVTGRWGYGTNVPDDAWWAMLVYSAALVAQAAAAKLSGGVVRTESGGASTLWSDRPFAWHRQEWQRDYEAAVARYRRVGL